MKRQESNTHEYYTIDLIHVAKALWRRAWLIALAGILTAAIAFAASAFVIPPKYSSSIKLYVSHNHRLSRWLAQPYKGMLLAGLKAHRKICQPQADSSYR